MFAKEIYEGRRRRLMDLVEDGLIVLMGNQEVGMNYTANSYPFRQDSSFLYYLGIQRPGLAATLDIGTGNVCLYGDDYTIEDFVWIGPHAGLGDEAAGVGVTQVKPAKDLETVVQKAKSAGQQVHYLPPYRHDNMIRLSDMLAIPVAGLKAAASEPLIRAVVAQRSIKGLEEIAEMQKAVTITGAMHLSVMQAAKAGKKESDLAGIATALATGMGAGLAYPIILTINGQTLHNHDHSNDLKDGQLVLGDFGAETTMRYAGDITRTFPVEHKFSIRQKILYQIVLDAQLAAIEACKPGVPYKEVHLLAARKMTEGLADIGIITGDPAEVVAEGAHALFFPHGLGHMIGLDVHDMEDLGEDFVGYDEQVQRSKQFGTAYLRLGRALEPGFVLTVEPGLYFIPELIDQWKAAGKFKDFINYDKVEKFRDFSGIRIEDNVLITTNGSEVLGPRIPKTVEEVEAVRRR